MHTTVYVFGVQNTLNAYDSVHIRNREYTKCLRQLTYSKHRTSIVKWSSVKLGVPLYIESRHLLKYYGVNSMVSGFRRRVNKICALVDC